MVEIECCEKDGFKTVFNTEEQKLYLTYWSVDDEEQTEVYCCPFCGKKQKTFIKEFNKESEK